MRVRVGKSLWGVWFGIFTCHLLAVRVWRERGEGEDEGAGGRLGSQGGERMENRGKRKRSRQTFIRGGFRTLLFGVVFRMH
eukprot:860315-Amorphochlora_amoeboformis.AAC.1